MCSYFYNYFFYLLPIFVSIYYFLTKLIWIPYRIQTHFARQGIRGPTRHILSGNARHIRDLITEAQSNPVQPPNHDIVGRVAPHYKVWSEKYGDTFLFWFGSKPRLTVSDPDAIKGVLMDSTGSFEKVGFNPLSRQLFGEGLVGLKGETWVKRRKLLSPAFNMERVKGWVSEIATITSTMLAEWQVHGNKEFQLDVNKEFHNFAAHVISHVAFGSNYEQGKRIFELQEEQMVLVSLAIRSVYIPGFRFIPTPKNQKRWRINKEIRNSLTKLLIQTNGQNQKCVNSNNLLGLMILESSLGIEEMIDECKTFYFAGKDTTANFLTWVIVLLALHQDWQSKAREEVVKVVGNHELPNSEELGDLKVVSMVLKETLRLYPPATMINRLTSKDVKIGKLHVPAGTHLYIPTIAVHHDARVWGHDANEFNPNRFSSTKAHHLVGSYFPFGNGPTICIGQNLAMVEAKVAISMILQRFEFSLSPSYVHAPMLLLTLQPQYGAQVLFRKI